MSDPPPRSKMILSEELSATLDEPTDCVMMHRVEPSRLQLLALNLSERLHSLQENAEQVGRHLRCLASL